MQMNNVMIKINQDLNESFLNFFRIKLKVNIVIIRRNPESINDADTRDTMPFPKHDHFNLVQMEHFNAMPRRMEYFDFSQML